MNQKDLRGFTVRYMKYVRETGKKIPYEKYIIEFELTPDEKAQYVKYFNPFIRKRNMLAKMLRTDNLIIIHRIMRKQIDEGKLPNQYRLFLKEYYPQT